MIGNRWALLRREEVILMIRTLVFVGAVVGLIGAAVVPSVTAQEVDQREIQLPNMPNPDHVLAMCFFIGGRAYCL